MKTLILLKTRKKSIYYICQEFWDLVSLVVDATLFRSEEDSEFDSGVLVWIENSWVCPECIAINSNENIKCGKCGEN